MILIADSGSTKTDWVVLSDGKQVFATGTIGLNPLFRTKEEIRTALRSVSFFREFGRKIKQVNFFGAGCGNKKGKGKIESSLKRFFPAAKMNVRTDLIAAALAVSGNEEGVICILGTGSNCCYYDGKKVHQGNAGLGYILGDEASGTYFGKKLLQLFLYGKMSERLAKDFKKKFRVTRAIAIENIYNRPNANRYLASFAAFIPGHINEKEIQEMIKDGLDEFYETNISAVENFEKLPVHFVGSVAFYLKGFIGEMCRDKKLMKGKMMQKPINGLAAYYVKLK
jgi:glucosamine kinase